MECTFFYPVMARRTNEQDQKSLHAAPSELLMLAHLSPALLLAFTLAPRLSRSSQLRVRQKSRREAMCAYVCCYVVCISSSGAKATEPFAEPSVHCKACAARLHPAGAHPSIQPCQQAKCSGVLPAASTSFTSWPSSTAFLMAARRGSGQQGPGGTVGLAACRPGR